MNAVANALPHGLAHGHFSGSVTRTVHAKRREGKGPDRTTPDLSSSVETSNPIVQSVTRATATLGFGSPS